MPKPYAKKAIATLWAQLSTPDAVEPGPCWLWPGSRYPKGYGRTKRNGELVASRAVWVELYGPIPAGMLICHRCDTPSCVRPSHLFLGSPADNMADMIAKGRNRPSYDLDNVRTKIGPEAVAELRRRHAAGESQVRLAQEYNLHPSHVGHIVRGLRRARAGQP